MASYTFRGKGFMPSFPEAAGTIPLFWALSPFAALYGLHSGQGSVLVVASSIFIVGLALAPWWHTLELSGKSLAWRVLGLKVREVPWGDIEELKLTMNFAYRTRGDRWRWIGVGPLEHFSIDRPQIAAALLAQVEAHDVRVKPADLHQLQRRVWRRRARELGYAEWNKPYPPPERPSDWEDVPGYGE